jgi:hypothetical protein
LINSRCKHLTAAACNEQVLTAQVHCALHPRYTLVVSPSLDPIPIPPELQSPPPRVVQLRPNRRAPVLAKRIIFYFPGTLLAVGIPLALLVEMIFLRTAPVVPGRVSALYLLPGGHGIKDTYIHYSYNLDGHHFTDSRQLLGSTIIEYRVGMQVPIRGVRFLGLHFGEIDSSRRDYWTNHWLFWALFAFWGPCMLVFWSADCFAQKRLVRYGTAAVGRIVKKPDASYQSLLKVRFEYSTSTGQTLQRWMNIPQPLFKTAAINQPVIVLFDPNHPRRALIYDFCNYQAIF